MTSVAIIDYGLCNLDSVARAVEECGGTPEVTTDPRTLSRADRIILPGVGAFADASANLHQDGWVQALADEVLGNRIPFLGICLGMQLMAEYGEEGSGGKGLGWIPGTVRKFVPVTNERIPHMGWNEIDFAADHPLFAGIPAQSNMYFVHSYHFDCTDPAMVAATTPYCGGFTSVVSRDGHIFGTQFHPEKSQRLGFQLLRNFLEM